MMFSKKEIQRLMVPLILEMFLSLLVGFADSVMVASAGNAAVSAVSLVDSISVLMVVLFSALANGGSVVIGQLLGRGEEERARGCGAQLMTLLLLASGIVTALLLFFTQGLLQLLFGSAEEEILVNCRIYYRILMSSVPFLALFNGGSALCRITGDSRTPMRISVIVNLVNIAGNAVCIYVLHMGVAGVALPSLLSRIVGVVLIVPVVTRQSFALSIRERSLYRLEGRTVKNIFSIAIPGAIENSMFQFGKILLMSLVSTLSTASITANAIGNTVGNMHNIIGMGINIGLTTIVSRCVGAGDYDGAERYTYRMVRWVYVAEGIADIGMLLAIPLVNRMYGVTGEAAQLSTYINLIHGVATILFWPIAFMFNNAMVAAGDSRFTMLVSSGAMWIGRVALSYLLISGFHFGVLSIWIAWVIDWFIRVAFFIPRWKSGIWKTKAIH